MINFESLEPPFCIIGILSFSEIQLSPNQTYSYSNLNHSFSILIPLTGSLTIIDNNIHSKINAGEFVKIGNQHDFEINNQLIDSPITWLDIRCKIDNFENDFVKGKINLQNSRKSLTSFYKFQSHKFQIGRYGSRIKEQIEFENLHNFFIYSIAGSFEVEDRIIYPREALSLTNLNKIEFESLDQENLILIISIAQ